MYVYRQTGYLKGQIIYVDPQGRENPYPEKEGREVEFQSECLRLNREEREDNEKGYI